MINKEQLFFLSHTLSLIPLFVRKKDAMVENSRLTTLVFHQFYVRSLHLNTKLVYETDLRAWIHPCRPLSDESG